MFCDIDPERFTLDPARIEAAVTPNTAAIMPVHLYGYPCDTTAIEQLAARHNLRVIYDAAHAFGVTVNGRSIADFGDASVFSFHATKIYHTIEGGAVATGDATLHERMSLLGNFGILDEQTVVLAGTNAKMNEFEAAMGLLLLDSVEVHTDARAQRTQQYRAQLADVAGITCPQDIPGVCHNYAYFPVLVDANVCGVSRDVLHQRLRDEFNIYARHYFSPLCSWLPPFDKLSSAAPDNLPVAERVAGQVLCLPLFADLTEAVTDRICAAVRFICEADAGD